MAVDVYKTNDAAVLGNTFKVAGIATDPTTTSLTVVEPDGTAATYTHAGGTLTRTSAGLFTKTITLDAPGVWRYFWAGTGAAADVEDGDLVVYDPASITLYAGMDELRNLVSIPDTDDDLRLEPALHAACRSIDDWCGRRFYPDTTATARVYRADNKSCLELDEDFYTTTGLVVVTDDDASGSYETTWATTDYQLEPLNGVNHGTSGWPYDTIVAVDRYTFPRNGHRACVQITAKWGWAAPPEPVRQAAKLMAVDFFKRKDAPFGVAGFSDFGAIRVREDPAVSHMLAPYRRPAVG